MAFLNRLHGSQSWGKGAPERNGPEKSREKRDIEGSKKQDRNDRRGREKFRQQRKEKKNKLHPLERKRPSGEGFWITVLAQPGGQHKGKGGTGLIKEHR